MEGLLHDPVTPEIRKSPFLLLLLLSLFVLLLLLKDKRVGAPLYSLIIPFFYEFHFLFLSMFIHISSVYIKLDTPYFHRVQIKRAAHCWPSTPPLSSHCGLLACCCARRLLLGFSFQKPSSHPALPPASSFL